MNRPAFLPPIDGFDSRFAEVSGVRLHCWIGGDPEGQPVVLWHGFLSTGYAWRSVAPVLADAGLAVLVLDMRGYGDIEAPVMLGEVLRPVFAYTPEAMARGSMWWWILPLAPGVPERLIVGAERAFLGWFYEGHHVINHGGFAPAVMDEYLRTFSGREGVLGSLGVYRAALTSIAQTEPLLKSKIKTPVSAMGGGKGLGTRVGQTVALVAEQVQASVEPTSGHFLPEEAPAPVARAIIHMAKAHP